MISRSLFVTIFLLTSADTHLSNNSGMGRKCSIFLPTKFRGTKFSVCSALVGGNDDHKLTAANETKTRCNQFSGNSKGNFSVCGFSGGTHESAYVKEMEGGFYKIYVEI